MILPLIGGAIVFLTVLAVFYMFHKIKKPKHWSEGYIVLGKNKISKPKPKEPENNSMFPPGW